MPARWFQGGVGVGIEGGIGERRGASSRGARSAGEQHVCIITEDVDVVRDILDQFLFRHLLHWIEAMSIMKKSKTTITSVHCLHDWLHVCGPISTYKLH
jgi:hypothetical protein